MDNELIGMQTEAEGAAAQVTEHPDTTGEQSADAALKHLTEDLKIPKEKAERYLKAKSRQAAAAKTTAPSTTQQETRTITQPTEAQAEPESSTDAGQESTSGGQNSAARPSFDELIRDDEYKAAYQSNVENIVRERVAKLSGYKDVVQTVTPLIVDIATMMGIDTSDPEKLDWQAIVQQWRNDPDNYRRAATEKGIDAESAKQTIQNAGDMAMLRHKVAQMEDERTQSAQQQMQERIVMQHMTRLRNEEAELKKTYPEFSLDKEVNDPKTGDDFRRLTQPGQAVSLAQAYYLIHRKEIEQQMQQDATRKAMEAVAGSIATGQQRPRELNPGSSAGTSQHTPYNLKSAEERRAIKERVKRGEKVYLK